MKYSNHINGIRQRFIGDRKYSIKVLNLFSRIKNGIIFLAFFFFISILFQSCLNKEIDDIPAPENVFYINPAYSEIDLIETTSIAGIISYRTSELFSFRIRNESNESIQQIGNLTPIDGDFDNDTEEFIIQLDQDLSSGNYVIHFFNFSQAEIDDSDVPVGTFYLTIINDQ